MDSSPSAQNDNGEWILRSFHSLRMTKALHSFGMTIRCHSDDRPPMSFRRLKGGGIPFRLGLAQGKGKEIPQSLTLLWNDTEVSLRQPLLSFRLPPISFRAPLPFRAKRGIFQNDKLDIVVSSQNFHKQQQQVLGMICMIQR
jgi:hypothetical protein